MSSIDFTKKEQRGRANAAEYTSLSDVAQVTARLDARARYAKEMKRYEVGSTTHDTYIDAIELINQEIKALLAL